MQFRHAVYEKSGKIISLFFCLLCLSDRLPCHAGTTGQQIYLQQCATCHGEKGEGDTGECPDPLVGDLTLTDLIHFISESMPEDTPEHCVGPEAEKVARYIYANFYSPLAQARIAPARVRLSRLTVRQIENTLADLARSFTAPDESTYATRKGPLELRGSRGLQGDYYQSHNFQTDQRAFQRRDTTIDFDFGTTRPVAQKGHPVAQKGRPVAEKADGEVRSSDAKADPSEQKAPPNEEAKEKEVETNFSIRWQGSVFAAATGTYEFLLETPNGAKLWVNDHQVPLIDAWVASGDTTEHRAVIRLLGGRFYPLRIDLFKHKEKNASIRLKWLPPHKTEEVIPEHVLQPDLVAPTLVTRTPFPPDDRSTGYVRAHRISQAWDEATTYTALEVARRIVDHLATYTSLPQEEVEREARLRQFCTTFAHRAFRRPLSKQQVAFYIDRTFEDTQYLELAVKKIVLIVLKSPHFLYREVGFKPSAANLTDATDHFDAYDVASWLAFSLWDSLPDEPLLQAAATGQLESREQISEQAARMLTDRRAKAKLYDFLLQWLKLDQSVEIIKDPQQYPQFSVKVAADLRTSLGLLLEEAAWSETSDYRQLLLSNSFYANGRLARYYGLDLPIDASFQRIPDPAGQRVGLLSHPYLLARYAYANTSSPIHRGVLIARSLLGRRLMPPPMAVEPLPPELHTGLSTRQRVALQTKPPACQTCHMLINPLGFTLENFDAVGRFRDNEEGRPVDTAGSYVTTDGEKFQFWSVAELATFLAGSEDAHLAFVEGLFQFMINQPVAAFGDDTLRVLQQSFADNGYDIQALLAEIAATSVWRVRSLEQQKE
ncbi:MAG: DUF1592 domain-containing protein [Pirellulales bacterium]